MKRIREEEECHEENAEIMRVSLFRAINQQQNVLRERKPLPWHVQ